MKHSPKRLVAVVAVGSLAFGLSACGISNDAPSTEMSDENITLRMYWWGGDNRHQRTQEVIELFEDAHPNITVDFEFADWNGYWEKLATTTAGKNSPDVVQMDALYLAEYAERGALLDLSGLDINTSGMDDNIRDMGVREDGLYGIPVSTSSMALAVNADLLDEIGVPMPDNMDNLTYDEYEEWAIKVTEAAPDGVYGGTALYLDFLLELFARQLDDTVFTGKEVTLNPETLEAFFQLALDWSKSGASAPASVVAESSSLPLDQLSFSTGKVVSHFIITTQINGYAAASGANIELFPLPNVEGGAEDYNYFKPGMYWSVSSQSEHPAEAAALVDFFLNDPEAVKIIGSERGIPAMSTTLDIIRDDLTQDEIKAVDLSESQIPTLGAPPAPLPSGTSDMGTLLTRYQQEVQFERMTPAEAATAYIAELQASVDAAN